MSWSSFVGLLVAIIVLAVAGPAAAQPPLLELSQQVVTSGTTITVTVLGTPGHFYGVATSDASSGLGPGLELGPSFTIVGSGQLDADGRGAFPLTVAASPSPLYIQGATSPDPGFGSFVLTPGRAITRAVGQVFTQFAQVLASGTVFFPLSVPLLAQPTELGAQTSMPTDCEARGLRARVHSSAPLGGLEQAELAFHVNGVAVLACTMNAAAQACDSGAAKHVVHEGDLVAIRVTASNLAPVVRNLLFTFLCA
jgi:hypothetical protein